MAYAPSVLPFRFEYQLTDYGWAAAVITVGRKKIRLTASYLTDALPSLLGALEQLWDGGGSADSYWEEEPGHYHWEFRQTDDAVTMRILAGTDTRKLDPLFPPDGGDPSTIEVGAMGDEFAILTVTAALRGLTTAVVQGVVGVLFDEGELLYLEKWVASRFPLTLLRKVERHAGLPLTERPRLPIRVADPGRSELSKRWETVTDGSATAAQTQEWVKTVGSPSETHYDPLLRDGLLLLRRQLRGGELTETTRLSARAALENWRRSAARYDSDPLEWHRSEELVWLAQSLRTLSREGIPGMLLTAGQILDQSDIDAMVYGLGIALD
jgi:hypothetical protein